MPTIRLVPPDDWPTLGPQIVDWCACYLCHGPGDVQGERLFFDDEFCAFIEDAYRLTPRGKPNAGRRVVSLAEISRPKGRAKSELAGALVCAELIGPVRFDHWAAVGEVSSWGYAYAKGEPVGKPVTYPVIRCLSVEEKQAGNTYDNVRIMLEHAKEKFGGEFDRLDVARTRVLLDEGRGGDCRPCSSGAASKDGGKETFAVADEDHLYYLPETRDMYDMVSRNLQKRKLAQPWMLCTTTQFEPGKGSVAEDNRLEAERLMSLKRRHHEFMWDHREGGRVDNWDDDDEVMAALEEAYGSAAEWMDLEGILQGSIRAPGKTRAASERYFINRSTAGSGKAIDPEKWDRLAEKRKVEPGTRVMLAFDGSEGGATLFPDHTVIVGWTVEKVPHLFLVDWWGRPPTAKGDWRIPRNEVRAKVTECRERYRVARLVCDPPLWHDEIDNREHGWVVEFGLDSDDEPICTEFHTNQPTAMDPAIDRFIEAVDQGNFTHDGSSQLRWYALNALLGEMAGRSHRKVLLRPGLPEKIDGLVAAVFGYDELQHLEVVDPVDVLKMVW